MLPEGDHVDVDVAGQTQQVVGDGGSEHFVQPTARATSNHDVRHVALARHAQESIGNARGLHAHHRCASH
jgi:hypothetical protein